MQPGPKTRRKRQPKPKPGYDRALKELLLAERDAFLALIAPGLTWVDTVSEELPAGARRVDLVWLVEDAAGRRFLLHIELQVKLETDKEKDICERMAEYALRLFRRDHLPVYSTAIFLKLVTTPEPVLAWEVNGKGLHFEFEMVRLWEQQPEVVLETDHYGLWPLAGLMGKTVTAESTFAVAEKIARAPVSRQEKSHLIGLLGVLVGMRLPRIDLMKALERDHMIEEIWKESSFADAVAEITRKDTTRRIARLALEGRFGPLSDEVLAAIQAAEAATLEEVVGAQTLEQVRARLGLS